MFRALWVRVLVAGLTTVWGCVELLVNEPFWGVLFLGAGGWLSYNFFVIFDPKDYEPPKPAEAPADLPEDPHP